jgi:hypothetical protein
MTKKRSSLTPKLRHNWLIDAALAFGAVLAIMSSLYFLAFPVGGYQGGRNKYYDFVVIFSRHTWDIIHTWSGAMMIMAALIHILIHWKWITSTTKRTWQVIRKKRDVFGPRLTYNILLDAIIAVSFLICAISGVYFMFFVESGPSSEIFLFSKTTWDLIHTWSGVIMTITAVLHLALHWKWVTNITRKMFAKSGTKMSQQPGSMKLNQA